MFKICGVLFVAWIFVKLCLCCEKERPIIKEEVYDCNKTKTVWTKEKCMLFFQCDKQVNRVVRAQCVRNVSVNVKVCCDGYRRDRENGKCTDVDECLLGKHGCKSRCVNLPGTFKCDCPPGYQLADDNSTCLDINECVDKARHNCSHSCLNSEGSYTCVCPVHLRLHQDGRTCEAVTSTSTSNSLPDLITSPFHETITSPSNVIVVSPVSGYRTSDKASMKSTIFAILITGAIAIFVVIVLVIFSIIYRRRRRQWPFWRKKPYISSPTNSVCDMINTSDKSKVLDDSAQVLGIDTSKARVFKKNSHSKSSPFATISNSNKCSVAFSSSSVATGVSSVTLMCPNVIAGSETPVVDRSSMAVSEVDREGNSHIYCELRDGNDCPSTNTPTGSTTVQEKRPASPCYASLPIAQVPLILIPETSPPSKKDNFPEKVPGNIYNEG